MGHINFVSDWEFHSVLIFGLALAALLALPLIWKFFNPPGKELAESPRKGKRNNKFAGKSEKGKPGHKKHMTMDRTENMFAADSSRSLYAAEYDDIELVAEPGATMPGESHSYETSAVGDRVRYQM